jgi:hypothetical protein
VDEIEGESGGGGKAASGGSGEGVDEAIWATATAMNNVEGQHKVCPSAADDAKSVLHPRIPTQSNFGDTEFVSTPMDHENILLPQINPEVEEGLPRINPRKYPEGASDEQG